MDKRTMQVAGAIFVIVPMLWGAIGSVISLYQKWDRTQDRLQHLERWRCAMGGKPPETIDWKRSMSECRSNWEDREH